jgi:hypothetical protein
MRCNAPPAVARPASTGSGMPVTGCCMSAGWALRSRVASYWSDLRDRGHLAPMVARVARIEVVSCDSAHEAAWLERNLLEASLPPWNRTPGGQESAVYIRLDAGSATPSLTVACQAEPTGQVRYFGPYLGGLRRAVAALHRILPLCHAADRLVGAEHDLAGFEVSLAAIARPWPARWPRSWNASPPRSAGRTASWNSCATAPPRSWPTSWPPGSRTRSAR